MKIKLLTVQCGPLGNHFPGEILDLPQAQAREYVERKFGAWVDAPPPERTSPENSDRSRK